MSSLDGAGHEDGDSRSMQEIFNCCIAGSLRLSFAVHLEKLAGHSILPLIIGKIQ